MAAVLQRASLRAHVRTALPLSIVRVPVPKSSRLFTRNTFFAQPALQKVAVAAAEAGYDVDDQDINDEQEEISLRVGDVVEGTVDGIRPFGAFIRLPTNSNGLLHISEVSSEFVDSIEDHLAVGESVKVYIKKIDRYEGRISLSTKRLERNPGDFLNDKQSVFDGAEEMGQELRRQYEERKASRDAEGPSYRRERRYDNEGGDYEERPRGGRGGRGRGGGGGRGRGGGRFQGRRRDEE